MLDNEDKKIINDLFEVYPEEGCGLLINKRGKIVWKFCETFKMGSTISTVGEKRKHSECEDEEGGQTEDDRVVDVVKRYFVNNPNLS